MTEKKAFEIIKKMHHIQYYSLNDVSTCLDGDFSIEELKAIAFIMDNKLSDKITIKIAEQKR